MKNLKKLGAIQRADIFRVRLFPLHNVIADPVHPSLILFESVMLVGRSDSSTSIILSRSRLDAIVFTLLVVESLSRGSVFFIPQFSLH